ncbi:CbtB domain-containing protein [Piscinibacter sp.]|uniref:CbtB domain-containing protein n=1 Tax=Piscinibacter sp. TaxID=1903157 RepID=UPI00391FC2C1
MNRAVGQGPGAISPSSLPTKQSTTWSAIASMLMGALIIYGAGFAPGILHGQSHDSRHTLGFICH